MTVDTELNLDALYVEIQAQIKAAFPDLETVEFDREDRDSFTAPACLLELTELEKFDEPDPGTEQLAMVATFEAHLILGFRTPAVKREARKLAMAIAHFVHLKRWNESGQAGCVTGPGEVVGCYRDDFTPELDKFECWKVEFQHVVYVGPSIFTEGTRPERVFVSFSPDIGVENEHKYTELTE